MKEIFLTLNNEPRSVFVEPNEILLDVLRDKLGVKSPKCGCERGDCGACTVLLDGQAVRSCLILAMEVEGHSIMTVEGISTEKLSALQEAFIQFNSFQCGYCAPGIILAITELLEKRGSKAISLSPASHAYTSSCFCPVSMKSVSVRMKNRNPGIWLRRRLLSWLATFIIASLTSRE